MYVYMYMFMKRFIIVRLYIFWHLFASLLNNVIYRISYAYYRSRLYNSRKSAVLNLFLKFVGINFLG